jgi:hypothetical protein
MDITKGPVEYGAIAKYYAKGQNKESLFKKKELID